MPSGITGNDRPWVRIQGAPYGVQARPAELAPRTPGMLRRYVWRVLVFAGTLLLAEALAVWSVAH